MIIINDKYAIDSDKNQWKICEYRKAAKKTPAHVAGLESELNGLQIPHDIAYVDFLEPMKGKRSLERRQRPLLIEFAKARIPRAHQSFPPNPYGAPGDL